MKLLFCLWVLVSRDTCHDKYLMEILHNSKGIDYFLVVNAMNPSEKKTSIVLSSIELSQNLGKDSFGKNDSVALKIANGEFYLSTHDSSRWFAEVKHYKSIDKAKSKGETDFIEKYFDKGGYLKPDVPFKYLGHIIEVLFEWEYLVKESEGNVYVDRNKFCGTLLNIVHEIERHH